MAVEHGRLDQMLVSRGLARSRTQASQMIREGLVSVEARIQVRPGVKVSSESVLEVQKQRAHAHYVARSALKLRAALATWNIDPNGWRCLDVGASTGGFTQVLLEAGASEVVALDVGRNQLAPRVRNDARVRVHEGINARHLKEDSIGGSVRLTVVDVSFISLTLLLEPLVRVTVEGGELIVLVKPQFEVGKGRLGPGGVVKTTRDHKRAVLQVIASALRLGLVVDQLCASPVLGKAGNKEFLLLLRRGAGLGACKPEEKSVTSEAESFLDRHWPIADPSNGEGVGEGTNARRKSVE